jgi:hypothetical protein
VIQKMVEVRARDFVSLSVVSKCIGRKREAVGNNMREADIKTL